MSLGSDDAPERHSSGILAAKPKLRFALFAVAAVLTWACLEMWLSLIYPGYPVGSDTVAPTLIGFVVGCVFAAVALVITFILVRTHASGYLIGYVVFGSITLLTAYAISGAIDDEGTRLAFRSFAAAIVAPFGLIAVAVAYASSFSAPAIGALRLHLPEKRVVLAFLLPLAAWLAISFIWPYTPFNPVIHPDAPDHVAGIHRALGYNVGATFLYLAILVPIGEEILFRGLITRLLRKSTNVYIATLLSATIFALFHIDSTYFSVNQLIYIFCLGVVLAITMFTTRSVWPGITLHALNNALVSLDSIVT